MLIRQKTGTLNDIETKGRAVDRLPLEWHETGKRILHRRTTAGREITLKFLQQPQNLQQDDVLYVDEEMIIAVQILPCEAIIVQPKNMREMATVCYEIGNKHLPLFYEEHSLLIPYEAPLFRMLVAAGFDVKTEQRQLLYPLKTSVAPHAHQSGESLFSKILKLTATPDGS